MVKDFSTNSGESRKIWRFKISVADMSWNMAIEIPYEWRFQWDKYIYINNDINRYNIYILYYIINSGGCSIAMLDYWRVYFFCSTFHDPSEPSDAPEW